MLKTEIFHDIYRVRLLKSEKWEEVNYFNLLTKK